MHKEAREELKVRFKLAVNEEQTVKRYQYTAIVDATRIRALRVFPKHNWNKLELSLG